MMPSVHQHEGLLLRAFTVEGDQGFSLGPIDLAVEPGSLTSIIGPTGAGKSLLLYALAGLHPSKGEAWIAGQRLESHTIDGLRPCIGLSFQRDALALEMTAAQNVALAARRSSQGSPLTEEETAQRTQRALELVGLEHAGHKLPSELSGGMRRRVGLARALATGAPLLLLDDATAGLDPSTAAEVLERVLGAAQERPAAVVLVTADVDTALPRSSQILLLEHGHVAFCGAPGDLPASGPLAPFSAQTHLQEAGTAR